jgi:hypothetical protein
MTTPAWPPKDPDETLDFVMDWSERLASGDEITASVWTDPDGIVTASDSMTTTTTTLWLSGGTLGETYTFTNTVTTDQGRIMQQTVKIKVKAR